MSKKRKLVKIGDEVDPDVKINNATFELREISEEFKLNQDFEIFKSEQNYKELVRKSCSDKDNYAVNNLIKQAIELHIKFNQNLEHYIYILAKYVIWNNKIELLKPILETISNFEKRYTNNDNNDVMPHSKEFAKLVVSTIIKPCNYKYNSKAALDVLFQFGAYDSEKLKEEIYYISTHAHTIEGLALYARNIEAWNSVVEHRKEVSQNLKPLNHKLMLSNFNQTDIIEWSKGLIKLDISKTDFLVEHITFPKYYTRVETVKSEVVSQWNINFGIPSEVENKGISEYDIPSEFNSSVIEDEYF